MTATRHDPVKNPAPAPIDVIPVSAATLIPAEIIVGYIAPYADVDTIPPAVVIRCGEWSLRYSRGPHTGTFWDIYGDDFQTIELARSELAKAPPVPAWKPGISFRLTPNGWEEWEKVE